MKTKQITITLEQVRSHSTYQRFDKKPGDVGDGPWTETERKETRYDVVGMKNAVVLEFRSFGPNDLKSIRVGDSLTEAQAQEVASMKSYEVIVKS